jgi:membrane protein DedA with SNARE-associated domain
MTLESIINTYGYAAILVGTFVEGETILILAGFAAHRGYLTLPWVILAGFIGSLSGDQLFFFLGRWYDEAVLSKYRSWKGRVDRVQCLLNRFQIPLILGFRFLYGLRTVTPFVIGMSRIPAVKFLLLNGVGALVWSMAVGTGGYLFGSALEILIGNTKHYEVEVFGAIVVIGVLIWIVYFFVRRSGKKPATRSS